MPEAGCPTDIDWHEVAAGPWPELRKQAYIAYTMQADPVGLIIAPVSEAVASGGAEVSFKKVRFHYYSIEGYKAVIWSVHGLT